MPYRFLSCAPSRDSRAAALIVPPFFSSWASFFSSLIFSSDHLLSLCSRRSLRLHVIVFLFFDSSTLNSELFPAPAFRISIFHFPFSLRFFSRSYFKTLRKTIMKQAI